LSSKPPPPFSPCVPATGKPTWFSARSRRRLSPPLLPRAPPHPTRPRNNHFCPNRDRNRRTRRPRRRLWAASPSVFAIHPRRDGPTRRRRVSNARGKVRRPLPQKQVCRTLHCCSKRTNYLADVLRDQPPSSSPAFMNIVRAEAPSQPRARLRTNFKNITVRPSGKFTIPFFAAACLIFSLPSLQLNRYENSATGRRITNPSTEIITNDFPTIAGALDLLQAMQDATGIEAREPSNDVAALLDQLDRADPDSMDADADDSNESWGHAQFTAGGVTIRSALVDWEAVGGTSTAFKLIAAAVRTCKVARAMCATRGRSATAYLADNYLELLFEQIQRCWEGTQVSKLQHLHFTC
jgi:hypothetical protein